MPEFFQAFFTTGNFKTQFIIGNYFLYCNLFDPEKTYTKVKSTPNRLCNS